MEKSIEHAIDNLLYNWYHCCHKRICTDVMNGSSCRPKAWKADLAIRCTT